jgi:hypothetical protein
MDKEAAKFLLQSFRPDGADASDADFADALLLASTNRELGEWLMHERAFDAKFAEALERVTLPHGLRESVLLTMSHDAALMPDALLDPFMFDALAAFPVPCHLRDRVIESMTQTAAKQRPSTNRWRFALPFAAAAGIAMAFLLGENKSSPVAQFDEGKISVSALEAGFVSAIGSPKFHLDQKGDETKQLIAHLRKHGLPCGAGHLPPGLVGVKGLGCCELKIAGKRGSLFCFDDVSGTVHLIIFKRNDVSGNLPEATNPEIDQSGAWAKACWQKDGYAFALMGMRSPSSLADFF